MVNQLWVTLELQCHSGVPCRGQNGPHWPLRYLLRHTAYHTLDHVWEV